MCLILKKQIPKIKERNNHSESMKIIRMRENFLSYNNELTSAYNLSQNKLESEKDFIRLSMYCQIDISAFFSGINVFFHF